MDGNPRSVGACTENRHYRWRVPLPDAEIRIQLKLTNLKESRMGLSMYLRILSFLFVFHPFAANCENFVASNEGLAISIIEPVNVMLEYHKRTKEEIPEMQSYAGLLTSGYGEAANLASVFLTERDGFKRRDAGNHLGRLMDQLMVQQPQRFAILYTHMAVSPYDFQRSAFRIRIFSDGVPESSGKTRSLISLPSQKFGRHSIQPVYQMVIDTEQVDRYLSVSESSARIIESARLNQIYASGNPSSTMSVALRLELGEALTSGGTKLIKVRIDEIVILNDKGLDKMKIPPKQSVILSIKN